MSQQPNTQQQGATETPTPATHNPGLIRRVARLVKQNWVVAFIFVLVMIHASLFAAWKLSSGGPPPPSEVTLGEFAFAGEPLPGAPISHVDFRLHVALLDGALYRGHQLLAEHRHKVQQAVEELLRKSHSADFDDPQLGELKRRMQATINRTLGEQVVGEVIITDLELERVAGRPPAEPSPSPALWRESTSS